MEAIEPRKLFVGGVSRETNEDTLRDYFSQYGTVKESLIIRHRLTGLGRGFGFVTFSAISMAKEALKHKNHVILGREVEVKIAIPKGHRQENSNGNARNDDDGVTETNTRKIFVGGLPLDLKEEEFQSYFESFGTVIDPPVMPDKETGQPRGFGFITFDSEEAVNNVLQNRFYILKSKRVEVKRAHPKDRNDKHKNRYDCNNTSLGLGGGFLYSYNNEYFYYPPFQIHQFYGGRTFYGFNVIGTSPSWGLLASGNPADHNGYVSYPSYGGCTNIYCNGCFHRMPPSTASGNSNGIDNSGVVEAPETRKSHDLSSLKIGGVEHQEGEKDYLLSSKRNAAELQIAEINDSTVQKPMPQSSKSKENGHSSHDS